jgi:prepilin-type N-terminal cleavage/methylation domain-containing protein
MSADPRERRGFTLVELLLAIGLFSILLLALLRLVDTALTIWGRTDENRELIEMGGVVLDLLAEDIQALEGGARGDLLADWALVDLDRDGITGAPRPRLRLVRNVGARERQRSAPAAPAAADATGFEPEREVFERGLYEVCWVWLPGGDGPDERAQGVLWRGERQLGEDETLSFFDRNFLGPTGKPPPGSLHELTGGVLWLELLFAGQTSVVHDGWELGGELSDCAASWDAWRKERPDAEQHAFNLPLAGMPAAKDVPLLPRRVRVELELERPEDLRLRTHLSAEFLPDGSVLEVQDGRRLPARGELVLIDEEWLRVLSVDGNRASVERARRGTRAAVHPSGALVHHGWRVRREIPMAMTCEDWDL